MMVTVIETCSKLYVTEYIKVFDQQMHSLLPYKMLKFTVKTSVYFLLHVSVHMDQLQGAHVVPC
jgi:hypothetical protein